MSREYAHPTKCDLTIIKTNAKGERTYFFHTNENTSNEYKNWYPASTIKFVAAILAAKRLIESGFDSPDNINITFHYSEGLQQRSFVTLIDEALKASDNIAYNELVILAGHKLINDFLISKNYNIALNKPYLKTRWKALTGLNPATLESDKHTFAGCRITVSNATRTIEYPAARSGSYRLDTSRSSSCSTKSLADFLNDFIFDYKDKFLLNDNYYNLITTKLKEPKSSGQENFVEEILSHVNEKENWEVYHKPGFYNSNKESDGQNYCFWCDTIVFKSKDSQGNSFAVCAYGGELVTKLVEINKNQKIDKQKMLSSNYYPSKQNHLGVAEGIGLLINDEGGL